MPTYPDIGEHVKAGRTGPALAAAKAAVRDRPSDPGARVALSVLFAATGDRDRALDQWKLALDLGCGPGFAHYGAMIRAEGVREEVFLGGRSPALAEGSEVPELGSWLGGLAALEAGDASRLAGLLDEFLEPLERIRGSNGEFEFEGFRCCDARSCWFIEGVFDGDYRWLPLSDMRRIRVPERPELLGDFLWLPVSVQMRDGRSVLGHVFATAPFTSSRGLPEEQLGRRSGWDEEVEELDLARGIQLFGLGGEVVPVFKLGDCALTQGTEAPSGS